MPSSSACTSPRSRLGMAPSTLRRLCDSPALTRSSRKECRDRSQQSIMTVSDNEINLDGASPSQVLQQANPSILAFLGTGSQSQHLFVSGQINSQGRQDN